METVVLNPYDIVKKMATMIGLFNQHGPILHQEIPLPTGKMNFYHVGSSPLIDEVIHNPEKYNKAGDPRYGILTGADAPFALPWGAQYRNTKADLFPGLDKPSVLKRVKVVEGIIDKWADENRGKRKPLGVTVGKLVFEITNTTTFGAAGVDESLYYVLSRIITGFNMSMINPMPVLRQKASFWVDMFQMRVAICIMVKEYMEANQSLEGIDDLLARIIVHENPEGLLKAEDIESLMYEVASSHTVQQNSPMAQILFNIIGQIYATYGGALDSTGFYWSYIVHRLSAQPELNVALKDELGTVEAPYTWEKVHRLTKVNIAMKDALRAAATSYNMYRAVTTAEPVELGGEILQPGAVLVLWPGAANLNPENYPDPEAILLDRPDNGSHSLGGAGRPCWGQQTIEVNSPYFIAKLVEAGVVCDPFSSTWQETRVVDPSVMFTIGN